MSRMADDTFNGRVSGFIRLGVYLDPKELAFLGFLVMISFYKSLKRQVFQGPGKPYESKPENRKRPSLNSLTTRDAKCRGQPHPRGCSFHHGA